MTNEELVTMIQKQSVAGGDIRDLLEELYRQNEGLIYFLSRRYAVGGVDLEDLKQEAFIALQSAALKFRVDAGNSFSSFFALVCKNRLTRYVNENRSSVKIPEYLLLRVHRLETVTRELMETLGREPTMQELSSETGLSVRQIREAERAQIARHVVSLDAPVSSTEGDSFGSLGDIIPDSKDRLQAVLDGHEAAQMRKTWAIARDVLTERELLIVREHYGHGRTYKAISDSIGISPERCRQLAERGRKKLIDGRYSQLSGLNEEIYCKAARRARNATEDVKTGDTERLALELIEHEERTVRKAARELITADDARVEFSRGSLG